MISYYSIKRVGEFRKMALLPVLRFPDPRLRNVAEPVAVVDTTIKAIVADMLETMYAENGVGLAAIQVNIKKQIVVMDISDEYNKPLVLINPQILEREGKVKVSEGCLSVPGVYAEVERSVWVKAQYLDAEGKLITVETDGLFGHCIQHEIDHLNGKLFVDYLSPLKRERIRAKLDKLRKQTL